MPRLIPCGQAALRYLASFLGQGKSCSGRIYIQKCPFKFNPSTSLGGGGGGGGWRWSIGMQQLLRASDVSGRGRGLVAVRPLAGGQLLLRESPLLIYAEAEAAACGYFCAHCARCLASSAAVAACGICSRVRFCGPECRVAAEGSSHTPLLCAALTRLVRLGLETEVETQGRFLIAAFGLATRDPSAFQQLLLLYGHADAGDDPGGVASIVEGILRESTVVEGKGLQCFSVELMMALLSKDKKNAFGLMAPASQGGERKVRAYAFYAQASLFNHDCLPNACRFDYLDEPGATAATNTDIHVRLLHDVPQGAEICLSYFPVNWTYFERQKRLLEDYGFQCRCERCKVEEAWSDGEEMEQDDDDEDAMGAAEEEDDGDDAARDDFPHAMFFVKYLCPAEACGGTMAPLPDGSSAMECNVCGLLRTEEAFAQDLQQHGMHS